MYEWGVDDVALFHGKLLGKDPDETDPMFRLTWQHQRLYTGYVTSGARGYSGRMGPAFPVADRFLATMVLALYQTMLPGEDKMHPVVLLFPMMLLPWYRKRLEDVVRYIFRLRKGERAGCRIIKDALNHLRRHHRLLQIPEPDRWVIFGFTADDPLPPWAQGHLL